MLKASVLPFSTVQNPLVPRGLAHGLYMAGSAGVSRGTLALSRERHMSKLRTIALVALIAVVGGFVAGCCGCPDYCNPCGEGPK